MTIRTLKAYEKWSKKYDSDPNPHILLEHNDVIKLLKPNNNDLILDAACGTGKYIFDMQRFGARVIGVDFSKKMIEVAKHKYSDVDFYVIDLRKKLPFKNNYFSKINCAQALKHIRYLSPTFKEFYRILKPNGIFVFSVTHPEMDWTGYELSGSCSVKLPSESDIYHHKFQYYIKVINDTGFKIDYIHQVPITNKIKHLLTKKAFNIVKGRYQIIIFKLIKK